MSEYATLCIGDAEAIRTITLNRPGRRNALTRQMIAELTSALAGCSEKSIQVVILTGSGEAFCSGLDLSELQTMATQSEAEQHADSDRFAALLRTLYACPRPTIAAVNGAAVAGGMGLATLCDFTLAAPDARFGYPEVKIGFIPALVSVFLKRQIGDKHARDLLLTGRLLDAEEAHALGLVTRIVDDEPVLEAALLLAATLQKNSPASLAATKELLRAMDLPALDRDLAAAAEANAAVRKTPDFKEGLAAFLEKRRPSWMA